LVCINQGMNQSSD